MAKMGNTVDNNMGLYSGGMPTYAQMQQIADNLNLGGGTGPGGKPRRPVWDSLLNQQGVLQNQYQLQDTLDTGFLDQMRADALRGPGEQSAWRQLMEQNVQRQAGEAMASGQAQTQAALSNLAMRGGVGSGTAERVAAQGAQAGLQAGQNVLGQRLQLDIQDEANRMQGLRDLGQAEMGAAQFQQGTQQFNIQNALNEVLQRRAADINTYNEQMRAWAAERTARATPSSGGSGKK